MMNVRFFLKLGILLLSLFVASSCGKDGVCVFNVGSCNWGEIPNKDAVNGSTTTAPNSNLVLKANKPTYKLGDKIVLTATGGTPPLSITANNTSYTAGSVALDTSFVPDLIGNYVISLTDAKGLHTEVTVKVTN